MGCAPSIYPKEKAEITSGPVHMPVNMSDERASPNPRTSNGHHENVRVRARRKRRLLRAGFVALALAVTLAGAALLTGALKDNTPIDPNAHVMRIDMMGFSPNTLTVRVGEAVKVDLINPDGPWHADGGGYHNFVLEQLGVNETVKPQSQLVFEFIPSQAGDFMWYCGICCGGKESPSMQGRLKVTP